MSNQNRFSALAELNGQMPKTKKKKGQVFNSSYQGPMLAQMRSEFKKLYPDHKLKDTPTKEMEGRALKRVGKLRNNPAMIEDGRNIHYGHLDAISLMQQHPSAFLRKYNVSSDVEYPETTTGLARRNEDFRLFSHNKRDGTGKEQLAIGRPGNTTTQAVAEYQVFDNLKGQFKANFLPMKQMAKGEKINKLKKTKYLDVSGNNNRGLTVTAHLSGCSISRQGDKLMHLRPHESGMKLHESLKQKPGSVYGRGDYEQQNQYASTFVMINKKPDGRVILHHQTHDPNGNVKSTGKRELTR